MTNVTDKKPLLKVIQMKFIKIVSQSITTPEDMFTLGVSTSRGKVDKIGQFGSGTLLGTLAWIRAYGISPIFVINGKKITFETKEVKKSDGETFNQILMVDGRKKTPLSVALEYGVLDWPTACLGLREWISNALDAGATPANLLTLTNKIEATENEVAVFVPYTDLAKEYFDNIEKYFLHFSESETERVIEKPEISKCRIYRKGVFIRELTEVSIFDYNIDFNINECRTGSSDALTREIEYEVRFKLQNKEKCSKIVAAVLIQSAVVETKKEAWDGISVTILELFAKLVGAVGLCPNNFMIGNCTPICPMWHKAIVKDLPALNGLSGVSEAEIRGFTIVPPSDIIRKQYDKYCELIEVVGMSDKMARPSLTTYDTQIDINGVHPEPKFFGLYDISKNEVMVWIRNPNIGQTIVHELAHHYTLGADDYTPKFAKFGHDLVAAIMNDLM